MKYLSSKEAADKWGIGERRVQRLCNQDRIPGARNASDGMLGLVPDMTSWEKVKDKVTVRVIGVSRNTELLKDVPCRLYGDIALIYQVSVRVEDDTLMTVRITNTFRITRPHSLFVT